jgi:hypothetical protein
LRRRSSNCSRPREEARQPGQTLVQRVGAVLEHFLPVQVPAADVVRLTVLGERPKMVVEFSAIPNVVRIQSENTADVVFRRSPAAFPYRSAVGPSVVHLNGLKMPERTWSIRSACGSVCVSTRERNQFPSVLLHPPPLACESSASYGEMSRRSGSPRRRTTTRPSLRSSGINSLPEGGDPLNRRL